MWLGVAREVYKRDVRRWQIPHNLVAGTHAADFAQFGDAIAVVVDALVGFDVQDAPLHRVCAVGLADCCCQRLACQILFVIVQVGGGDVVQHLVLVVAHRNQFSDSRHLPVRNQAAIVKGPRTTVNQQLLGRHCHDLDAPVLGDALDLHVVQHLWWRR